jgi:hypothetical protein
MYATPEHGVTPAQTDVNNAPKQYNTPIPVVISIKPR